LASDLSGKQTSLGQHIKWIWDGNKGLFAHYDMY